MKKIVIKYSILIVSAAILKAVIIVGILVIWPEILIKENIDGSITTYSSEYIDSILKYLLNIVFVILIAIEFKKLKIKSIPILIVTFFSSIVGVLFFLIVSAYDKLIIKTQDK